ncbi:GNAT family N-acetyltransferase [Gilvimarinus agarilyticus]|uniref:GNAT family N-acetyltransferase n=1 Tax=Gilvimarinus sp. 2_MG-2023 TaxID=3062666 RepID=UPI001C098AA3|nr:GNAT family N-acetyltransferase [Gilvimarinus sp. 2_MG-2023]MBU2884675.1 GNAT family N-acetyltransferase [Gilvimarinus agarilyticus]MDO6569783.1 GNAT family N-acetyltransferase [Gilvimarinus sp. 2_MG-2023]
MKLRKFTLEDAARVALLAGDESVSEWTANIPFPYSETDAINWITATSNNPDRHPFAIEVCNEIVGCVSYWPHDRKSVEVGYWVGKSYWGKGFCTTALQTLINLESFPVNVNIVAKVMAKNIASEKVLVKCGFSLSGQCAIKKHGNEISGKLFIKQSRT